MISVIVDIFLFLFFFLVFVIIKGIIYLFKKLFTKEEKGHILTANEIYHSYDWALEKSWKDIDKTVKECNDLIKKLSK